MKWNYPHNIETLLEYPLPGCLPDNAWMGVSVTCTDDLWRIDHLRKVVGGVRFVSFEPLLEDIHKPDLTGIDWVIIGAETGRRKDRVHPRVAWIGNLSAWATSLSIPIFHKDNLRSHIPDWWRLWQYFPEAI